MEFKPPYENRECVFYQSNGDRALCRIGKHWVVCFTDGIFDGCSYRKKSDALVALSSPQI